MKRSPHRPIFDPEIIHGEIETGHQASRRIPSGGDITNSGCWRYHTFLSDDTFDPVGNSIRLMYLAIGGGGSGGGAVPFVNPNSGGGGGHCYHGYATVSASQAVTVGQGGVYAGGGVGNNGTSTVFGSVVTAPGGNRGIGQHGGDSGNEDGTQTGGNGVAGQIYSGGGAGAGGNPDGDTHNFGAVAHGGGGGLAGAGAGFNWRNLGTYYGGGGAGIPQSGGTQSGSEGRNNGTVQSNGIDGWGQGGYNTGRGGSGVLIVRYPTCTLPQAIHALNPIGYWKLNEATGIDAIDYSGNGHHGTYTGSGYTLHGNVGDDGASYADFGNGASSYVAIPDHTDFTMTSAGMTWFMLVDPDSVAGTTAQWIVTKAAASNFEWGMAGNNTAGGRFTGEVWNSAGTRITGQAATGMTTGWQALAFRTNWGGSINQDDTFTACRNSGASLGSHLGGGSSTVTNGTAEVRIGWRGDSPATGYWQGGIAHVAIFNTELSDDTLWNLMDLVWTNGWNF